MLQVLLVAYTLLAVGAGLIGGKVQAGYCLYGTTTWLVESAYPPLVYYTFLHDHLADEEQVDMDYYSEMRESGYLEDDSDDVF
jgi:hypothetical protein